MVRWSGEGRICWTSNPAGIKGKRRLARMTFSEERRSSYVLIPPQNDDPAARKLRENSNYSAVDTDQVAEQSTQATLLLVWSWCAWTA